jgi:hypothetical protein
MGTFGGVVAKMERGLAVALQGLGAWEWGEAVSRGVTWRVRSSRFRIVEEVGRQAAELARVMFCGLLAVLFSYLSRRRMWQAELRGPMS